MQTPLELTFTNMDASDFVDAAVREKVQKLERLYDGITSCHVFIDAPHHSQHKGNHYEVRIEVRVPGTELMVNSKPGNVHEHEDVYVTIRDAFQAMERQLKRWKQKASGQVKSHDGPLQGRIAEIHHDRGYGQILATDGRLIYFHENSVVNEDFKDLAEHDTVELVVQSKESPIGPQASTVRPISGMKFTG